HRMVRESQPTAEEQRTGNEDNRGKLAAHNTSRHAMRKCWQRTTVRHCRQCDEQVSLLWANPAGDWYSGCFCNSVMIKAANLETWSRNEWKDGVQIDRLNDLEILVVETLNSFYEITVICGKDGDILV